MLKPVEAVGESELHPEGCCDKLTDLLRGTFPVIERATCAFAEFDAESRCSDV